MLPIEAWKNPVITLSRSWHRAACHEASWFPIEMPYKLQFLGFSVSYLSGNYHLFEVAAFEVTSPTFSRLLLSCSFLENQIYEFIQNSCKVINIPLITQTKEWDNFTDSEEETGLFLPAFCVSFFFFTQKLLNIYRSPFLVSYGQVHSLL